MKKVTLILLLLMSSTLWGAHSMGGYLIYYQNVSGDYIFRYVFLRDCNGQSVNNPTLNLDVFNYPGLTSVTLNRMGAEDISPSCTQVSGGAIEFQCGIGAGAGNGPGAVERIVYESNPITLSGAPPAEGWIFARTNTARDNGIVNLQNPGSKGFTYYVKIFINTANSINFSQTPNLVACQGFGYEYNPGLSNDLADSVHHEFSPPLDDYDVNNGFDLGTNPVYLSFVPPFSYTSPSDNSSIDPVSGVISLNPSAPGDYCYDVLTSFFRGGEKIAEFNHGEQAVIIDCPGYTNNAPVITPTFDGQTSFDTTVYAGVYLDFPVLIEDMELLQDGSAQQVTLSPSSSQFGNNYTDPSIGCDIAPCATLNGPLIDVQQLNLDFQWQTACEHLIGPDGIAKNSVTYEFVLKATDDYCSVPEQTYQTITITVLNQNVIDASEITCIDVQSNGDVQVSWAQADNSTGSFGSYEIFTVQDGLVGTITDVATTTYLHTGAGADIISKDYYIVTNSGCGGVIPQYSDTLTSILLAIDNPGDGFAGLSWNNQDLSSISSNGYYQVWKEYPVGNWILVDSVPFSDRRYSDSITVCSEFVSYEIRIPTDSGCSWSSNEPGDIFQDQLSPYTPSILAVDIDTLTGEAEIIWDVNAAPDTYGYVVYQQVGGFFSIVDTVWGRNSNSLLYTSADPDSGPVTFSIAAFDSCFADASMTAYNTSPKSPTNSSIHLTASFTTCARAIQMDWEAYAGQGVDQYYIYYENGGNYVLLDSVSSTTTSYTYSNVVANLNIRVFVAGLLESGELAFSNGINILTEFPELPDYNYLHVATVTGAVEVIGYFPNNGINISNVVIYRSIDGSNYDSIGMTAPTGNNYNFSDNSAEPSSGNYWYRTRAYDTCNYNYIESNFGKTIYLQGENNSANFMNSIWWDTYEGWSGETFEYLVYRSIDDGGYTPIGTQNKFIRAWDDYDVATVSTTDGKFCYYVEAIEINDTATTDTVARSNTVCVYQDALIYAPNAFTPYSINNIFQPIISYDDVSNYQLVIYNRAGKKVFETTDYSTGWDGTARNGVQAPLGVYVYVIELIRANGDVVIERGHVTLVR